MAVKVVIAEAAPIFNVPVATLVKPPAPLKAVVAVTVPLLVNVPAMVSKVPTVKVLELAIVPEILTLGITVAVEPLIVLLEPEKVCVPVLAVQVVALLVKLPPKPTAIDAAVSFQTPPLLTVTSPVKVFVPVPELASKVKVPLIVVAPPTVKAFRPIVPPEDVTVNVPLVTVRVPVAEPLTMPPLITRLPLTVRVFACPQLRVPLIVRLLQAPGLLFIVTVWPATIVTSSPEPGTWPQLQVPAVFQLPLPVELQVKASALWILNGKPKKAQNATIKKIENFNQIGVRSSHFT